MEIVKSTENLEPLNQNIKENFYIVPNLSFNIEKMRAELNLVLKKKKFNTRWLSKEFFKELFFMSNQVAKLK